MEKIKFSHEESAASEIVRVVLLGMLREGEITQIPRETNMFKDKVEFVNNVGLARTRFLLLVHEIFWELIIQRVITPGLNTANPNLPFFRLTEYGEKVVKEDRFSPHDPANYLVNFSLVITNPDPVVFAYVEESLRCFTAGCLLASALILGVASEVVFLNLCDVVSNSLGNPKEKSKFSKTMKANSMIAKFTFVRDKIEVFMKKNRRALPEDTIITLLGVFDLIRRERNDIGHPQNNLPTLTRDQVFIFMRMFPHYYKTVQAVEGFLKGKTI